MPKILDHTNISLEDAKNLIVFFEEQSQIGIKAWDAGTPYSFTDGTSFYFRHTVIQRARKEGNEGVRYEFINDHIIGSGSSAQVYSILCTLAITKTTFHLKPYGSKRKEPFNGEKPIDKKRIVKVQHHTDRYPVSKVQREYNISKKLTHLAIKPPTFSGTTSYLVMRKLQGIELFEILNADFQRKKVLSLEERLELSNALLNALKNQVTDKGIIHGDIKGENIMVDISQHPISVNILDYAFGVSVDSDSNSCSCTPAYSPPEIFACELKTPKIDVFSMGRVLALLWRVSPATYEETDFEKQIYNASNVNLDSLFSGIDDLNDDIKKIIKSTLQAMLKTNYRRRISIEGAISEFAKIIRPNPVQVSQEPHLDEKSHEGRKRIFESRYGLFKPQEFGKHLKKPTPMPGESASISRI